MPIVTTTAKVITDAELARANALEAQVDAQAAEIVRLRALVTPARTGLYVDGTKLRTRFGVELRLRVLEVMLAGNLKQYGYAKFLAQIKNDLGANAVAPLFEDGFASQTEVKAFLDAALLLGLVVFVNADHQGNFAGGTQGWADEAWLATLMNGYPNVILECDVETYVQNGDASTAAWVTAEKAKVAKFRAAGHKSPIKVGAHAGGRDVSYPLAKGAEVLAADPEHNLVYTFQAYWGAAGTWYQSSNNFADGLAGTKAALAACAVSGLCFVPGFDVADDVGSTNEPALLAEAIRLGLSHAHWVATGDFRGGNNCYDWDFLPSNPAKSAAAMLAAAWLPARAAFPDAPL
ncbi:MAG: hypothetical protein V4593_08350 [Pseudomonadota bacterium]